ncbi:hypothetical protein T4B_10151 [Trichinella pseudospiralis]|uniref:Uncharacterized protein n=2 Tax=Trichinella pseudospiralis TaxID=6337 RepID=A0A0V1H6Z0_TRIPS|nr:hypothetical protein T4B_10151 [Trichinella pseudospiralis]
MYAITQTLLGSALKSSASEAKMHYCTRIFTLAVDHAHSRIPPFFFRTVSFRQTITVTFLYARKIRLTLLVRY